MSVTTASAGGSVGAAQPQPTSRLRRLVRLYASPGDRTPTGVGLAIGLLAAAGMVVLGPTSQFWLLACTGLLVYAVIGIVRPLEVWRILRDPLGPARRDPGNPLSRPDRSAPEEDGSPETSGWLPTRRSGGR